MNIETYLFNRSLIQEEANRITQVSIETCPFKIGSWGYDRTRQFIVWCVSKGLIDEIEFNYKTFITRPQLVTEITKSKIMRFYNLSPSTLSAVDRVYKLADLFIEELVCN